MEKKNEKRDKEFILQEKETAMIEEFLGNFCTARKIMDRYLCFYNQERL